MTTRTVQPSAIKIGERDREELGDIEALSESISAVGLLHPIVVTESLDLIAGGRRLVAVRQLGWREVPVTVVNLSTVSDALRAEADENTQRKPLTPYEASRARERRARVLAEDAERRASEGRARGGRARHEALVFPKLGNTSPSSDDTEGAGRPGSGEGRPVAPVFSSRTPDAAPIPRATRDTSKAAAVGTGYSGSTLDKVDVIRAAAERGVVETGRGKVREEVPVPEPVREVARKELETVKQTGAAVDRAHRTVAAAIEEHLPKDPDDPHRKWRREFLSVLSVARKPMQFTAEAVAERADDECLDEMRRLVDDLAGFHRRVRALVDKAPVDNVRQLRVV